MRARAAAVLGAAVLGAAVLMLAASGCTGAAEQNAADSASVTVTSPTTVGTSYRTVTTSPPSTQTIAGSVMTVTSAPPEPADPPAETPEPEPVVEACPYLSNEQVSDANGQRAGRTSVFHTEPYPVCEFTRADGNFLAAARIVVADSPAAAHAAVDAWVPVDVSDPAGRPGGWEGGAMGSVDGVDRYPEGRSVYAVAKGDVAIIAVSNQAQSVKGRQMVTFIIDNLAL